MNRRCAVGAMVAVLSLVFRPAWGGSPSGKSRTFLAGEITMSADLPTTDTPSFTSTPINPLKKGDQVAAMTSEDQAWSVAKLKMQVGKTEVAYPVLAIIKCADDDFRTLFPATFKAKKEIKAGETLHADGYSIESSRAIKAGDSIPVTFASNSYLSLEASEGNKDQKSAKPWLIVFKEDMKPETRSLAIEAWRIVTEHVAE